MNDVNLIGRRPVLAGIGASALAGLLSPALEVRTEPDPGDGIAEAGPAQSGVQGLSLSAQRLGDDDEQDQPASVPVIEGVPQRHDSALTLLEDALEFYDINQAKIPNKGYVTVVEAHYLLRTDDGVLVEVHNRGLRHGPDGQRLPNS